MADPGTYGKWRCCVMAYVACAAADDDDDDAPTITTTTTTFSFCLADLLFFSYCVLCQASLRLSCRISAINCYRLDAVDVDHLLASLYWGAECVITVPSICLSVCLFICSSVTLVEYVRIDNSFIYIATCQNTKLLNKHLPFCSQSWLCLWWTPELRPN